MSPRYLRNSARGMSLAAGDREAIQQRIHEINHMNLVHESWSSVGMSLNTKLEEHRPD